MGLYAGRTDPRKVDVAAIGAAMRPALEAWFTGHVKIVDPNTLEATEYNARTDTGGDAAPKLIFDSGPGNALLQSLRIYDVSDFGDQSFGQSTVRIQLAIPDGIQLHTGLMAVVVDGGNDAQLTGENIVIDSVVTSSIAWNAILRGRVIAS
jgi:hypothetical protein